MMAMVRDGVFVRSELVTRIEVCVVPAPALVPTPGDDSFAVRVFYRRGDQEEWVSDYRSTRKEADARALELAQIISRHAMT